MIDGWQNFNSIDSFRLRSTICFLSVPRAESRGTSRLCDIARREWNDRSQIYAILVREKKMSDEFDLMPCGGPVPEEELDGQTARIIAKHPCFNREASRLFGRIHLAVAPECNIQCNFCLREFDCVNESRPGVASKVLTPAEALDRVERVMATFEHIHTVGIAGPGEPLYN